MKDLLISFVKVLFPTKRFELILFTVIFLIYSFLAIFIGIETNITDQTYPMIADAYFSFDNPKIMHHGIVSNEAHPFAFIFTTPLLYIGIIFTALFGIKGKVCFLLLFCTLLISLSAIYIYRYLKNIIELKTIISIILTLLYASTSTCISLCFTLESYPFSLYFLSLILYYYSLQIKYNRNVSLIKSSFLAFILGGITTTNLAKGIIPLFFTTKNTYKFLKQSLVIGVSFILLVLINSKFCFFDQLLSRQEYAFDVSNPIRTIFIFFWGAPIVFPGISPIVSSDGFIKMIILRGGNIYYSIFTGMILLFTIYAICVNIKNKQVQLLLACFSIDIILHIFIKYGIESLFIYGGHWIFIVPLLLGWLYKSMNKRVQKKLNYIYLGFLICIIINNGYWIVNFITLAKTLFPA